MAGLRQAFRAGLWVYAGVAVCAGVSGEGEIFSEKISTVAGLIRATKPLPDAGPTMEALLFSPRPRHPLRAGPFSFQPLGGTAVSPAQKETGTMRQLNSFLRSAQSRIGRRLAQIVAIAAASLPAAGA
jgi:hypothetical protein